VIGWKFGGEDGMQVLWAVKSERGGI